MKINDQLFTSKHAFEAYGDCPECGKLLVLKYAKKGPFVGCSSYPNCSYTHSLKEYETTVIKEMPGMPCPKCETNLAIKKGRYGMYVGCMAFPDCDYISSISQQSEPEMTNISCLLCGKGHYVERINKQGKSFYACSSYPKCKHLLNAKPLAQTCPKCALPVMLESNGKLVCTDPKCIGSE